MSGPPAEPPEVIDPVSPIAAKLLGCLVERLEYYDVPVCRAQWYPGATATWDACGVDEATGAEGQAWVAVPRIWPTENFPDETSGAHRCSPSEYAAEVIVGVLRCAHTVDDDGVAPSANEVTEDAVKTSRDRAIALEAVLCCFVDDDTDPGTFRLGAWEPLGPQGSCVGGQWRLTVRVPACPCPPELPSED